MPCFLLQNVLVILLEARLPALGLGVHPWPRVSRELGEETALAGPQSPFSGHARPPAHGGQPAASSLSPSGPFMFSSAAQLAEIVREDWGVSDLSEGDHSLRKQEAWLSFVSVLIRLTWCFAFLRIKFNR